MHAPVSIVQLALCLCLPLTLRAAGSEVARKPNVILIFIDDLGWADLGCFGNRDARTPNIDRIASEGIRFTHFYVNAPICSPSRVAISTGQYPQRWRITSYLAHRSQNRVRGMAQWLDPRAPMLARALRSSGYATGHFGKWHMGGQRDVADAPAITEYGFDVSLTNFEGMGPKLLPLTQKPGQKKPRRIWADAERLGGPAKWRMRSTITRGFVDAALAFIDEHSRAARPFYLNLWPDDVHGPWFPPLEKWKEGKRPRYLAVLEAMDRQLGPLFDRVRKDPALRDNTVLLLCSDNGHAKGAGNADPLRGAKAQLFEGGIRSPLIVWGPGSLARHCAGTTNDESVFAAFDLVPSLLRLAGVRFDPSRYDGEDVLATLLGRSRASRNKPICFSRPPDRRSFYGVRDLPDLAVRAGRWKLLCDYDGERVRLHDVVADPGESDNLAARHPAVATRLSRLVRDWFRSLGNDSRTHLVLDDRIIDRTEGVELTIGRARKHRANPLEVATLLHAESPRVGLPVVDFDSQRYRVWQAGVCRAASNDGLIWKKPVAPTGRQPGVTAAGTEGRRPFRYRDVHLAFVRVPIAATGRFRTELEWSPDAVQWSRIDPGKPLIPPGGHRGSYDWAGASAIARPVLLDDRVRVFYRARDRVGAARRDTLALATLRPDGFAGYEPTRADRRGTVVTRPVVCSGGAIRVTVDADGGSLRVVVLGDDGRDLATSDPVTSNVTDHAVGFSAGFRPTNKPVRLRFELESAKLYAFR